MAIRPGGAPLNIANGVREFSTAMKGARAVIDGERSLTYAELGERSDRVGSALRGVGLQTGQRVAVVLGNRLEYLEIAAGIAKAGLVMVPLNPRLTGPEMLFIAEHAEVSAIIVDQAYADAAGSAIAALPSMPTWSLDGDALGEEYESVLASARAVDPAIEVDESEPFMVAYTSGTTGRPKGVKISHRSRCLTFTATALEWGLGPGRSTVAVAPLYHGAGFAFAYAAVYCGATVSMLPRWDPEGALDLIARSRANSVFLVPTHAQMMRTLDAQTFARFDLSALDTLYFNAAAMPFPLKEWVLETFPGVDLYEVYGSTEAGVVTVLRPDDQLKKPGSVGPRWFHTELRLVDGTGSPVRPGEIGEVYSRSPFLMNGYLHDDRSTAACTTDDGFLTSGDLGLLDKDGYLSIVDRVKDMIVSGGVNVYPREVEDVLVTHPDVAQVAVAGVLDEQWGEVVAALVVPRSGSAPSEQELAEFCREHLAGFKVPKVFGFTDALPANPTGKILKREVRDRLGPS